MRSRTATSSSSLSDPRLERWLELLIQTPGLTSIRDPAQLRRVHLDESLSVLPLVKRFPGPVADVGSGGGAPGIPLASALPGRAVVLIEANGRKCDFLERVAQSLPKRLRHQGSGGGAGDRPVRRGCGEGARCHRPWPPNGVCRWSPPVAPLCCSSARPPTRPRSPRSPDGSEAARPRSTTALIVVPKVLATPEGFPRRPGVARKRPLV